MTQVQSTPSLLEDQNLVPNTCQMAHNHLQLQLHEIQHPPMASLDPHTRGRKSPKRTDRHVNKNKTQEAGAVTQQLSKCACS